MLAFPIVVGGMVGLGVAGGDFVKGVEGADALAGGEVLDLNAAVRRVLDFLRQTLGAGAKTGEIAAPGRNDHHLDPLLGQGGGGQRAGGGTANGGCAGAFDKGSSFHQINSCERGCRGHPGIYVLRIGELI